MRRWLAALVSCLVISSWAESPAVENAVTAGRRADAAALQKIVESGDRSLVSWFGRGMQLADIDWSPEIEAIVIARFADPKVGDALRAMPGRYHTRQLYDLHRARVVAAYDRSEPSIGQLVNTDLQGIEEDLLVLGRKLPRNPGRLDGYTEFVALRRHPAAIPLLFETMESLSEDPRVSDANPAVVALLWYPSIEIWQRAAAKFEAMNTAGRLTTAQYRNTKFWLDRQLHDPQTWLTAQHRAVANQEYLRRTRALDFSKGRRAEMKLADPAAYVREEEPILDAKNSIAREIGDPIVARSPAQEYFHLGLHARFRAADPSAALRLFARAAERGVEIADFATADTYQFDLNDRARAIAFYQRALAASRKPPSADNAFPLYEKAGSRVNAWWQAWLAQEISYLRTGRAFSGTIGQAEIGGFFEVMLEKSVYVTGVFAPEFRVPNTRHIMTARGERVGGTWSAARDQVIGMKRETLQSRLDALPSSRLALMMALRHVSALPDADAIVAYFARNDPSGYWSTCVFGTVAYLDSLGERRRDEAVRNESAELLPGMTVDEVPRPLSVAAARYMKARNLRAKP